MTATVKKYLTGDRVIWGLIIALAIYSVLAVYSSTGTLAYKKMGGNTAYFFVRHGVILMAGFVLIYIVSLIHYKYYFQLSLLLLVFSLILLFLTLLVGTRMNEASRWLTLPGLGFTFQTSDMAKMSLLMYLARELSMLQDERANFRAVMKRAGLPLYVTVFLIAPANLSTALILFTVSLVLMFVARIRLRVLLSMVGVGLLFGTILLLAALATGQKGRIITWQHRIENYIHGDTGDEESNYQLQQAKIAVATGGLFGKKPGKSTQRNFLPHSYSDFIFAIIVEEYGLAGAIILVSLYLSLLFRAEMIVRKCKRTFPAFLVVGMTLLIVTQAFVNMGVSVGLLPVTGQTLPLVSMGGSSMIFTAVEIGIILNVSRMAGQENEENVMTDEEA